MIITKKEFDQILEKKDQRECFLKVDFGLRTVRVRIEAKKAIIENRYFLDLNKKLKDTFCYMVKEKDLLPVAFFSKKENRFYKLIPTKDWPSIAIGSVPMHSITLSSPYHDTLRKIKLLNPYGVVLDTCMGLGYTALCAAKQCSKVITFERDENVLSIAEMNPLSKGLFTSTIIEIRRADVVEAIKEFNDETFECIIHDPPTFKLSPELYSVNFYDELRRVLKKRGRLYHYMPRYKVRRGYNFPLKIREKCKKAGFSIVTFLPEQGDLLCTT